MKIKQSWPGITGFFTIVWGQQGVSMDIYNTWIFIIL